MANRIKEAELAIKEVVDIGGYLAVMVIYYKFVLDLI